MPASQTHGVVTGYKIKRDGIEIGTATFTNYRDMEANTDTLYTYSVIAVYTDPEGEAQGVEASIYIPRFTPPADLTAQPGDRQVVLKWRRPTLQNFGEVTGYRVFRDSAPQVQLMSPADTTYTSTGLYNGLNYTFYVRAIYEDPVGESDPSNIVEVIPNVDDKDDLDPPVKTQLYANYPNPFNPTTQIAFSVSNDRTETDVAIDIYNIKGQYICNLIDSKLTGGDHTVTWKGKDATGQSVGSGIYFYRMKTDDYQSIKKMILMK